MSSKSTPMIKQYLSIKEQYPDAILFYRMGDFYEMFFEDAKTASRILEITLTSRNKNHGKPIPMCGVPHRAVQSYIARLIRQGYKVAICDQVEDPAQAKGLVRREVVRVITPGMIIENEFLDARANNYVLAVTRIGDVMGLAYLDISTGTFRLAESEDRDAIADEVLRVSPSEILLPESVRSDTFFSAMITAVSEKAVTFIADRRFGYGEGRERLTDQFQTLSLEGFGCETLRAGVGAAGVLLYYVGETQKQKISHISGIETYALTDYLCVDDMSCRNLELMENLRNGTRQGTLLEVLDQTVTAMGGRRFRHWLRYPLLAAPEIEARLDAVEEALGNPGHTGTLREALKSVYDLERLGSRIVMGHAGARDLIALKRSLATLPAVMETVSLFGNRLFAWREDTAPLSGLAEQIENAIREDAPPTISEGGIIREGYSAELDELIKISKDGKGWLARLEAEEKEATGISSLKVRYNKVFGYYIEVPRTHSEKIPAHYVRKQTLVNAERYITDELKAFESKVLGAEDRRAALEYEIFNQVRAEVRTHNGAIQSAAKFLAGLDCLLSLAHIAEQNNYCRPEIRTDGQLIIEDGRHPVIEKMITAERFVPNTVRMDARENQILIITGPNMAGKSTVLRQVALLTVMAQMGGFVPARAAAVSLTDRIFTRVGALDNLSQGQSTFMVEMQETANILNNATPDSLVILDEIGRGTSTFDGLSIAWAVAEYLHDLRGKGVKTLFATHYHELTELAREKPRVRNYNIAVREYNDEIIFLRKLVEGGTNRSYGIQVARLAGIPGRVIDRARMILGRVEREHQNLRTISHAEDDSIAEPQSVQMGLFCHPEAVLSDSLKKLDITRITPLEAINYLNELQEKIKFH
ncbi:DNA mismatch repair protein MutS [Desulfonema ishimotonii]|uniref:DNA mismatch repair protein MutS n=1 Tax=Desulfonema ishimotonii TaxID=45657 RepID=A0A401FTW4_9BACT|nr:DNA mismatch repair protein MutS [Desulfonema ishimotonii]GBC60388.1 DNA mismatch repair protein MutS [Desulfonema ishimotonii]